MACRRQRASSGAVLSMTVPATGSVRPTFICSSSCARPWRAQRVVLAKLQATPNEQGAGQDRHSLGQPHDRLERRSSGSPYRPMSPAHPASSISGSPAADVLLVAGSGRHDQGRDGPGAFRRSISASRTGSPVGDPGPAAAVPARGHPGIFDSDPPLRRVIVSLGRKGGKTSLIAMLLLASIAGPGHSTQCADILLRTELGSGKHRVRASGQDGPHGRDLSLAVAT